MFRILILAMTALVLSGCVSTTGKGTKIAKGELSNEQVLKSSGNTGELIRLYKNELKKKDEDSLRLKLVNAYIANQDYESALFYLKPLISQEPVPAPAAFAAGKANFNLGDWAVARHYLELANRQEPDNASVMNLMGVVLSYQGDLNQARDWFVQARNAMADDLEIKNNLALLDIFEGNFADAKLKLESLSRGGEISPRVRANLAIVYAKLGEAEHFAQLMPEMSREDRIILFEQLRRLDVVSFARNSATSAQTGSAPAMTDAQETITPLTRLRRMEPVLITAPSADTVGAGSTEAQ